MKAVLLMAFLFGISCSVSKNISEDFYFSCVSDYGYNIYASPDCKGETVVFIPSRTTLYTKTPKTRKRVFVTYGSVNGWISKPRFKSISRTSYKILPQALIAEQDSLLARSKSSKIYALPNNKSSYSPNSFAPKTIHVKGYYRKDGTYVRPHTRSAPRRRY